MTDILIGQCARCGGNLAACFPRCLFDASDARRAPDDGGFGRTVEGSAPFMPCGAWNWLGYEEHLKGCGACQMREARKRVAELEASNARFRKMAAQSLRDRSTSAGEIIFERTILKGENAPSSIALRARNRSIRTVNTFLHWADAIEAGRVL